MARHHPDRFHLYQLRTHSDSFHTQTYVSCIICVHYLNISFFITSIGISIIIGLSVRIAQYSFAPPHTPAGFQSSSSPMIGLCCCLGWSLATGLTVKEPGYCLSGERHGFKEVSTYLLRAVTRACSDQVHTHSFATSGQPCCSPRSTHALHPAPTSGTASPPPHKRCPFRITPRPSSPLPSKPSAHSLMQ